MVKVLENKFLVVFLENYPNKGKAWCIKNIGMTDGQIRHYAEKYKLKSNFKFNPASNYNRGSAFRGKKRPEHSAFLKENHPLKGLHHSKNTKDKISLSNKIAHKEGRLKADNFKGHVHTKESKLKMAEASRKTWKDKNHYLNSSEYKQKVSDRMSLVAQLRNPENIYSRAKMGWETIGRRKFFFRSSWEVTYAKYLEFLKSEKKIKKWDYEADVFWFEKIKRGVRSYKPDFKVFNLNGTFEYHEVKGYMDAKSKTKLSRMAKYYPEIKMVLIDREAYKEIAKWKRLYDNV